MISDKYKIIFVHQKKAAGTSIKRYIAQLDPSAGGLNTGVMDPKWDRNDPKIEKYYKFTVVRNPYDRFVSGWKYCLSTKRRSLYDVLCYLPHENLLYNVFAINQSMGSRIYCLIEYIRRRRNVTTYKIKYLLPFNNSQVKRPSGPQHDHEHIVRQQSDKIYYSDGTLAVDQVVFFENLIAGLKNISKITKLPIKDIPFYNQTRSMEDDYRKYFDEKSLELFQKLFARDLHNFPYDFDKGFLDDGSGVLLSD